jgi:hypothetical protein
MGHDAASDVYVCIFVVPALVVIVIAISTPSIANAAVTAISK